MSGWTAKQFWKEATARAVEGGFAVFLDGRGVKTPAKRALVVPTEAMARAIAAEWDAQGDKIDPATMPVTRSANAALDKVAPQFDEVAAMIADYGGTDLLCYRAEAPAELVARQAAAWDPLLDWAATELGARLAPVAGVLPRAQAPEALARLHAEVAGVDAFRMAALHDLVAITGSLVLGLAVARGRLEPDQAWALSRIDEDWQIEHWGADDEAVATAAVKQQALAHAARFWHLCAALGTDAV